MLGKMETMETIRTCPDLPKQKTPVDKRNDVDWVQMHDMPHDSHR